MEFKIKVDSYSILIVAKYLQTKDDFINLICVCKNFKKSLKKLRFNPIPVHNTNLFPLMQTQFLYSQSEKRIEDVELYQICYPIPYHQYLEYQKEGNIKCSKVYFDEEDVQKYKCDIPEIVHAIGPQAYESTEYTSLTIPSYITSLEESSFMRMTELTSIDLSENLTSLPFGCFQVCVQLQNIIIPTSITSIDGYAFCYCISLKSIVIPDSVSYISQNTFDHCENLESILLPSSLKSLEEKLFFECKSLTSIEIPENVTAICTSAFEGCTSLKEVKIPLNLKHIGSHAFKNCKSLISLHIPSSCTYIGYEIISGCTALKSIQLPTDKCGYCNDYIDYEHYQILKKSITKFKRIVWNTNEIKNDEPNIPYECNYLSKECYKGTNIKEIVLSNNVRLISSECFKDCKQLTYVYFPDSLISLDDSAFENCTSLKEVHLSANLQILTNSLFKNCENLERIVLPIKLILIDNECFYNCKSLTSIHIPDECKIMSNCFVGCTSLKELILPNKDGVVDCEISPEEYEIFKKFDYKCNKIIFVPKDKNIDDIPKLDYPFAIGKNAYAESTKESIIIPSNVTRIYYEAFENCKNLTSIVISDGCVSIGKLAFRLCEKLEEITIPSTVTHFGVSWLNYCMNLKKVNVPNNILLGPVQIDQAFLIESLGVKCPNISLHYSDYNKLNCIQPQVKMIGVCCFQENISLKSLNIPTTIENISPLSFINCTNLTSLTIPSTVTKIGKQCFLGCCQLLHIELNARITKIKNETFAGCGCESIIIPTTVKEICFRSFSNCNNLQEIIIPSSITSIGGCSFINCPKITKITFEENCQLQSLPFSFASCERLEEIDLPTSITKMQTDTFNDCTSLTKISMPNMKHIEQSCFKYCYGLSSIELPSTLTYLGSYTFQFCCNLKEVNIPDSVVKLGTSVFSNCDSLTSVTLPTSLNFEEVDHHLFRNCSSLKEIHIGKEKVKKYPFKVTYSIMLQFKTIGIECKEVVLTREDLYLHKKLFKRNPIQSTVKYLDDNCFRNNNNYRTIIIHKDIVEIGEDCFKNCSARIINKSKIELENE